MALSSKITKIYAEVLEPQALEQFNSALAMPFAIEGALMPDAHTGYALPIGAVVSTDKVIVPAWVGYDIGCGMCALPLVGINVEAIKNNAKAIFDGIYEAIPVGRNINETPTPYSTEGMSEAGRKIAESKSYEKAIGSLGGGNHFCEIGEDETGMAWVVIHSGSRGVGAELAKHYMRKAHPEGRVVDGHWGLDVHSKDGRDYIADLNWALDYALANRKEMMVRVVACIAKEIGEVGYEPDYSRLINRNHNHAVEVAPDRWVHRKGATHAEAGMMGVIPGSMADGSFIVIGKGNPLSLSSSSHGAGRVLSRRKAKEQLNVADFVDVMEGITAKVDYQTLDESPFAYKNIHEVMALQSDLVEVVAHVKPIINIKG